MTAADPKDTKREITYHVGWKKGTIHSPNHDQDNGIILDRSSFKTVNGWIQIVEIVFWKETPFFPLYETHWLFSSIAAVCFIATLIYILLLGKVY